jgi:hypothetical protein
MSGQASFAHARAAENLDSQLANEVATNGSASMEPVTMARLGVLVMLCISSTGCAGGGQHPDPQQALTYEHAVNAAVRGYQKDVAESPSSVSTRDLPALAAQMAIFANAYRRLARQWAALHRATSRTSIAPSLATFVISPRSRRRRGMQLSAETGHAHGKRRAPWGLGRRQQTHARTCRRSLRMATS